jgi:GH43 family beta-xylosidase
MKDYHVFSSNNLTDWRDYGVILTQSTVKWVDSTSYSMWAPDCVFRNGKYYFYFPAPAKNSVFGRGFSIGVAISAKPYGPFIPQPEPVKNVHGIDPCVLIAKDGQAYLYWAQGEIYVAKLKKDMLELANKPHVIQGLPNKGLIEGPYVFERKGTYYLTYPHVQDKTERLEYAMANNPMGPFKVRGVVMDATPDCWTNQNSIVKFQGQWYLFYHHNDLSPHFDKNRSVRIDSLFFNPDGTIKKVIPTLRGVGITNAMRKIQIDRFSRKSEQGTSIAFLDSLHPYEGWKTILNASNAWIQYNKVHFGNNLKWINVRTLSKTGGVLQIRLDRINGPVIARIKIPVTNTWIILHSPLLAFHSGIHNLVVQLGDDKNVEIDWISFQ